MEYNTCATVRMMITRNMKSSAIMVPAADTRPEHKD